MKSLKAIIMAGGEGSRLRPLTCDCPKPMLPLLGKPLMGHAIELLKRHDLCEIAATLGYLPENITDYFGDGAALGVQLHYYIENVPLGTAGSVKQAQDFLRETFIVLSGDGVTDLDFNAALRFHRQHGSLATLVLKKSAHPQEYGMVVTDADGRITAFHEKPGRSDIYSDKINTGIYILEPEILSHIPADTRYDFGHDLFPALLAAGFPLYGYTPEAYWCDVGDVAAYLQVHIDALDGRIHLPGLRPQNQSACQTQPPVYIDPEACIDPHARIGPYSVIGAGCRIAVGASIKRSVLFPGAQVEHGAQLRGCVVGSNSCICEGAQLFEESVVGAHSRIGRMAMLAPGVKLWPQKNLPDGEHPEENIVWGACRQERFQSGALYLESPSQAARAVQGYIAQMQPRALLLGRSASTVAAAMGHASAAGAMAQGVQLIDAGICPLPALRHCLHMLHCDGALFIEGDHLTPLNADGARLDERLQRSVLKRIERQDYPAPFRRVTLSTQSAGNPMLSYIADLAHSFDADAQLAPQILLHTDGDMLQVAEEALHKISLRFRIAEEPEEFQPAEGEIGIQLSANGEAASFSDSKGSLNAVQQQLSCAWTAMQMGETRLILPVHATRAIDRLGANTVYLSGERAAWEKLLVQTSPRQFRLQHDGLYFALCFLAQLTKSGLSLRQWMQKTPGAYRSERNVPMPERESGRILRVLAQNTPNAELGGGIRLPHKDAWTWLGPDENGAQLHIISEAGDMETANELCDFYNDEIQRLLQMHGD